jgi:hypothetical protein
VIAISLSLLGIKSPQCNVIIEQLSKTNVCQRRKIHEKIRTIIMGAAGRDFHNFNTYYRENDQYEVVAFTATQIPNIDDRKYPAALRATCIQPVFLSCPKISLKP